MAGKQAFPGDDEEGVVEMMKEMLFKCVIDWIGMK